MRRACAVLALACLSLGLAQLVQHALQGPVHPDLFGAPQHSPRRLSPRGWLAHPAVAWARRRHSWGGPPPTGDGAAAMPRPLPPLNNQGLVAAAYSNPATGVYLGSPSIARLPNDTLLTSHDYFPEWGRPKRTSLYTSADGTAWRPLATVPLHFWSTLFVHGGAVYLLGLDDAEGANSLTISRSTDGGATWATARVLAAPQGCGFATGSVPVLVQGGVVFRGVEVYCGPAFYWPQSFRAAVVYARSDRDLLSPASWRMSEAVQFDSSSMLPKWMPGPVSSGGYLEGSVVPLIRGGVGLLLRCRVYDAQGRSYTLQHACLFHVLLPALDGAAQQAQQAQASWAAAHVEPAAPPARLAWQGFVDMPGGGNKFTARYDDTTGYYIALTNPSIDRYGANEDARNILTLVYSWNLLSWRVGATLLLPNDGLAWELSLWLTGYQYVDWVFDGDDLVAAVRTSWAGAHTFHDSNLLATKRVPNYRQYLRNTSAGGWFPEPGGGGGGPDCG